jgi:hypothetical protein
MNVTLAQLVTAIPAIDKLAGTDLPVKTSYRIGRLIKSINSELAVYNTERTRLIKKYGTQQDNGDWSVGENNAEFMSEMTTLTEIEVELKHDPISIETLGDIELSPMDMVNLEPFISD